MGKEVLEKLKSQDRNERLQVIRQISISDVDKSEIPMYIDLLGDEYWPVRERTAVLLLRLGVDSLPHLRTALFGGNEDVKYWSSWILGNFNHPEALSLIFECYGAGVDKDTAKWLENSLVSKNELTIDDIAEYAYNDNIAIRQLVAIVIGELKIIDGFSILERLLVDENWVVRKNAAESLGKIGDIRAVDILLNSLADEAFKVRAEAAHSLRIISELIEFRKMVRNNSESGVFDEVDDYRRMIISTITQGMKDSDPLSETVIDPDSDPDSLAEPFIERLKNSDEPDFIILGIRTLGLIGGKLSLEFLSLLLQDNSIIMDNLEIEGDIKAWKTSVNRETLLALAKIADEEYGEKISRTIQTFIENYDNSDIGDDCSIEVILAALQALSRMPSIDSVDLLTRYSSSSNELIREAIAQTLPRYSLELVSHIVYQLIEDESSRVRVSAIRSFSEMKTADIVYELINRLDDEDEQVISEVLKQLVKLRHPDSIWPIRRLIDTKVNRVKFLAINALESIGPKAMDAIVSCLSEQSRDVKFWALQSLKILATREVIDSIFEILEKADDFELKLLATEILFNLGGLTEPAKVELILGMIPESESPLGEKLIRLVGLSRQTEYVNRIIHYYKSSDKELRFACCEAIKFSKISSFEIVEVLIEMLNDRYWPIRKVASEALIQLGRNASEQIIRALKSDNRSSNVLYWSVRVLGSTGGDDALDLLIDELNRTDWHEMKQNIIKSIGKFDNRKAYLKLLQFIEGGDDSLCFTAVKALRDCSEPELKVPLIELLKHREENIRYWAAKALGNYSENDVREALTRSLNDSSYWVVKYAQESLDKINETVIE